MTLSKLVQILRATGYPVAFSHFEETPTIPFITYREDYSSNFHADNRTYIPIKTINVELYTDRKDLIAEQTVETVLNENDLPYETSELYIESERMHQKIYYIGVI